MGVEGEGAEVAGDRGSAGHAASSFHGLKVVQLGAAGASENKASP